MERARVRGAHLPPVESRRKQPSKGSAGSHTMVETVQHSRFLYFTTLALLSLSVFIHSGPYMARAGDMHTGVSYLWLQA